MIEVVDAADARGRPRRGRDERRADRVRRRAATDEAAAFGVAGDGVNPRALVARLDWERSYKSAYEVETLAEATVPAARGFRAAEEAFRDGATEMEAHHAFLAAAGVMEDWLPYPTIIGFGERSATLHYHGKRGTWAARGKDDARRRRRLRPRLRLGTSPGPSRATGATRSSSTWSPGWRRSRRTSPPRRGPG